MHFLRIWQVYEKYYANRIAESSQTSKKVRFAKIVNGWNPLIISKKHSILDVWQTSENASDLMIEVSLAA